MNKYPTKKLSEICSIRTGKKDVNYSTDDGLYPFFTCGEKIYQAPDFSFDGSAILIAGNGDVGACKKFDGKFEAYQRTYVLMDFQGIERDYLFYFLNGNLTRLVKQETFGSAIPYIKLGSLTNRKIPLPPLSTQSKIVAKLDEAFGNIDRQISLLKANIDDVERVRKSILSELFSGNYQIKKLQEVCEKITDGTHQTPTYFNSGYIFLSSKNVTSGKIDWNNIKYIDERQHQEMYKRVAPRKGDILLAKNGTTGVAAIVDRNEIFDIYVSLALIRPKDEIISEYLLYFINSSEAKRQFNSRLKGVGVPNLHLGEIKEVEIPLPPLPRQHEIVEHLDRVFTQTVELKSSYEAQIRDLETLRQSLLEEAFSGRLVGE